MGNVIPILASAQSAVQIPIWMLIPFATMLLCIAVLPLIHKVEGWWEHNLHKLLVSLLLGIPVAIWMIAKGAGENLMHQMLYDYVPFILLLMALFVTTGGICIRGDLKATPKVNTIILAIGWALASFMGTTGAAMLLIRLLLATNHPGAFCPPHSSPPASYTAGFADSKVPSLCVSAEPCSCDLMVSFNL